MTCKRSLVIDANAWCVILNMIQFYFWYGTSVNESIKRHFQDMEEQLTGVEKDITLQMAKDRTISWFEKAKKDCSFIYKEHNRRCVPCKKNFKEFTEQLELPFKSVAEMQQFIREHF